MRHHLHKTFAAALRTVGRSRARVERRVFHHEYVLGTSLELQVLAESDEPARRAEDAALREIDRLEAILSGWSATSELARWQSTHDVDVRVSAALVDVLSASERWRAFTGGAFDPAAQAIVERRRAGADATELAGLARALRAAHAEPLWDVDPLALTARRRTRHPVSLDAVAKGYVVTRAALRARDVDGVRGVLLNIGGDVQHFGSAPVLAAVADPFAPAENAPAAGVVRLHDAALATSGGYRRGDVVDGRRVSHIVDPRTGRSAEHVASASVLAPDGATADALSTAFTVLAPHESVALADSLLDVGCLLIDARGTVTANAVWNARAVHPRDLHDRSRASHVA